MSLSRAGSRCFHTWTQGEREEVVYLSDEEADRRGREPEGQPHQTERKQLEEGCPGGLHCLILKDATIHGSCVCILPPSEKKSMAVLEQSRLGFDSLSASLVTNLASLLPWQPVPRPSVFVNEWDSGFFNKAPIPGMAMQPDSVFDTYYHFFCHIFLEILPYPQPWKEEPHKVLDLP